MTITIPMILSWMLCGLIVGLIARGLMPGKQEMGAFPTMFLGLLGAFIGGLVYSLYLGKFTDPFSFNRESWPGWVLAIVAAPIALGAFVAMKRRRVTVQTKESQP